MVKMVGRVARALCGAVAGVLMLAAPAGAAGIPFHFSTGNPDGKIATASRPGAESGVNQETESADDFLVTKRTTLITHATFVGLIPAGASLSDISEVKVEIYRVFPLDSDTTRTIHVPTRMNSPSDVELEDRDSASGTLQFTTTLLSANFAAGNSVDTGIHPSPLQHTGGDGAVSGQEVLFDVTFTTPFALPPDHYFFVPQVLLSNPNDHFLWLSAPKPIVAPGTPFSPDLQSWIRNAQLAPDWLRIGTDIVGGMAFNATFSLDGEIVVASVPVLGPIGLVMLAALLASIPMVKRRCRTAVEPSPGR
jgi:hypothetical protein